MKILCFGDSNTYGYDPRTYLGDRLPVEDCWVSILAEKLGCVAVNAGENGREIPRNRWEMTEFEQLLAEEKQIDLLIIMLGTNDLLQGNSVTDVTKRMEAFLGQIHLDLQQVLLIAPPLLRHGAWICCGELITDSEILNESYKHLAKELGVQFADAGEWELPLAFDGVHLTREGHRSFADALYFYLRGE